MTYKKTRRELIHSTFKLALWGGALLTITPLRALGNHFVKSLSAKSLKGGNLKMAKYELPPLPYDYNALEPHIDEQTMRLHHDKHHLAYVNGANKALEELEKARSSGDFALVKHWERELAFHGSGHINHVIFWENMSPNGGGEPTGDLANQIEKDFGSFAQFKAHFSAAAKAVEGSGWAILGWDKVGGHLLVYTAENHQNQTVRGVAPLLLLDVWEHAYYLKYQNNRGAYVDAWWNVVNWEDVAKRFAETK